MLKKKPTRVYIVAWTRPDGDTSSELRHTEPGARNLASHHKDAEVWVADATNWRPL